MLIRGDKLTEKQKTEVLRTFIHRWTFENAQQTYGGKCPACQQGRPGIGVVEWHAHHAKLIPDREWLFLHAFHFTKDGTKLMIRRHAEPAYIADEVQS
jgi:hypothetical protein